MSDNALRAMTDAKDTLDLEKVWDVDRTVVAYNQATTSPVCDQPGSALSPMSSEVVGRAR
jgi:hypothetical protein